MFKPQFILKDFGIDYITPGNPDKLVQLTLGNEGNKLFAEEIFEGQQHFLGNVIGGP